MIKCLDGRVDRVLKSNEGERIRCFGIAVSVNDENSTDIKNKTLLIRRHHAIMHALDPDNNLFGISQRFFAFRGYYRTTETEGNPEWLQVDDHCKKVVELKDKEGDTLSAVCKSDVDHMLGYRYDCCLALHRCNHQVNQWLHHIRLSARHWGHPFFHQNYTEEVESRERPTFLEDLPPTLETGKIFGE